MSIYEQAVKAVENGSHYYVNIRERELRIGHKYLLKGTEIIPEELTLPMDLLQKDFLEYLRILYHDYKHSMPTAHYSRARMHVFRALKNEELSDEDFLNPKNRSVCEIKLLMWVLFNILNGKFCWDKVTFGNDFNEDWYFWQDSEDKDLVLFRKWLS